ncbi:PREDICTED: exosome complex component MTR3-like [Amphimedon queenslandica]|uniref:Exoribonuclease phosphorolytic domain-containing protein n=1 Tax=Amphimedon queenslandica TaxID=400682 RepID=A0A1X7VCL1_AMPQE|nr:PREDICTED: exosome complex component MTR3-like [Amphimedon queenslandica]|eukprot:XP_019849547.1 PREDICTED: exosome complex component MTR3-like [Amphimedon queenslandica]
MAGAGSGRRNRYLAPEATRNPLLCLKEKKEDNSILRSNQLRQDGRSCTDIRPVSIQSGIVSHVTSSAYIELGDTKVLCSILGPRHTQKDFNLEGQVLCQVKFAPFSCHFQKPSQQEEKFMSSIISEAIVGAIRTETFPKLETLVNIVVLENDGSMLTAAILCASIALATSGIEMKDLPTACTVSYSDKASNIYYDPTIAEEYSTANENKDVIGYKSVVYLPLLREISGVYQVGVAESHSVSSQLLEACIEGGLRYHERVRQYLKDLA